MDKVVKEVGPEISRIQEAAGRFISNVSKVVVVKKETAELVLVALLCEGHILIEDVPGIGKTMLAKAAAKSLLICCPQMLPASIILTRNSQSLSSARVRL